MNHLKFFADIPMATSVIAQDHTLDDNLFPAASPIPCAATDYSLACRSLTASNLLGLDSDSFFFPALPSPGTLASKQGLLRDVYVNNPPRTRLQPSSTVLRVAGRLEPCITPDPPSAIPTPTQASADVYITRRSIPEETTRPQKATSRQQATMAKKRRSLQSLFIPSFLQHLPASMPVSPVASTSRQRSQSLSQTLYYNSPDLTPKADDSSAAVPRSASPSSYLLDDDPFANLSSPSLRDTPSEINLVPKSTPRSPLSPIIPDKPKLSKSIPTSPNPSVTTFHAPPAGSIHARPAYQKPAFASRPSLPSLHTLSQMKVSLPKVRRGRVGAGLPHEPWNQDEPETPSDSSAASAASTATPDTTPDFISELDLSEDEDDLGENIYDELDASDAIRSTLFENILNSYSSYLSQDESPDVAKEASLPAVPRGSSLELSAPSLTRSASSTSISTSRSSSISAHSVREGSGDCSTESFPSLENSSLDHSQSSSVESETLHSPTEVDYVIFPPASSPDLSSESQWSSADPSPNVSYTPYSSLLLDDHTLEDTNLYENRLSMTTMKGDFDSWSSFTRRLSPKRESGRSLVDGGGWDNNQQSSHGYTRGWYTGGGGSEDRGGGAGNARGGSSSEGHASGSGDGGRDGNNGDRNGRSRSRSTFSTPTSSESSSSDEESTDDYGLPSSSLTPSAGPSKAPGSDEDDVPLAKRIPTALRAQKSIRKQARDEREKRRAERSQQKQLELASRSRQTTLRPGSAGGPASRPPIISSSQEAALHASRSVKRERTQTLPGNMAPFTPEDLTQKLNGVQMNWHSRHPSNEPTSPTLAPKDWPPVRTSSRFHAAPTGHTHTNALPVDPHNGEKIRVLRAAKSFHHQDHRAVPVPDATTKLTRGVTINRPQRQDDGAHAPRGDLARSLPAQKHDDMKRPHADAGPSKPATRSARTSMDRERSPPARPPLPPLAPSEVLASLAQPGTKVQATQQRIFVGDTQRFNMVEVTASTTAKDVLLMIEAQGTFQQFTGTGGWMLWEISQDFGMERPVRSFELLSDVSASWNKDKTVNTFMVRLTPLAAILGRSVIPTSSPTYSGYVEWESKRGKWSKRYMRLREHCLWLSKRDNGKDEVLLCSLSSFDAYFVTRVHKAPKPFVFAVKSTDKLSLFENTADYLHVLCCNEKDGNKWMENILLARSYVLFQERNVLFSGKTTNPSAAASPLARSGTRKQSSAQRAPPLLNPANPEVFEPGSLLHRQA